MYYRLQVSMKIFINISVKKALKLGVCALRFKSVFAVDFLPRHFDCKRVTAKFVPYAGWTKLNKKLYLELKSER